MRLYIPEAVAANSSIVLNEADARHLHVLRKTTGDLLEVTNGRGTLFSASIEKCDKKSAVVRLESDLPNNESPPRLHLLLAPTKQIDRMEWALEKCCELGLASLTPLISQNSERRSLRIDRLQRIAESALKQSLGTWICQINNPKQFDVAINALPPAASGLIAHCRETPRQTPEVLVTSNSPAVWLAIGPEGDFTATEVAQAEAGRWQSVALGNRRLRTETAAIAGVLRVLQALGDG